MSTTSHLRLISTTDDAPPLTAILSALSYALDLTSGQPMGHAQRSCLIGMRVAQQIELAEGERNDLYAALLIKDAGCSSNAARMHQIFGGNEIDAKRLSKIADWSNLLGALKHGVGTTLPKGSLLERARQLLVVAKHPTIGNEIVDARCNRGAQIAINIGLSPDAAECIRNLDEHWDGHGSPAHLTGDAIPLLARIACLAQTLEVFAKTFDLATGYELIRKRSGRWFDPALVQAAEAFESDAEFWDSVYGKDPLDALQRLNVESSLEAATQMRVDSVCEAFAGIVDAKSPYTGDHSARVSKYAVGIARQMSLGRERETLLRRAGLLHDIGKLAVPNMILDKPAKLSEDEFDIVRKHPYYSHEVLRRVAGFERIAEIAAAHHERLDGSGYFHGLNAGQLDLDQRILAVADVYDALSAERPYRAALDREQVFMILGRDAGTALDAGCIDAIAACTLPVASAQPELKAA